MGSHQIAQLNVGRTVAPIDDPRMADFVAWLDGINALAESSPGFVWRLQGDNGNATELKVTDDPRFIINLTMWESVDDLFAFTYRSTHTSVFARRYEWFERWDGPNVVLWWQATGTVPTADEALGRLRHLAEHGPSEAGFTFKQRFLAPVADAAQVTLAGQT